MTDDHAWVPFDLLEAFMVDVFKGVGVPEADARVCADVLISADKRGIDSHGVGRLKPIYYDRIVKGGIQKPVTEFEVVRDCKATAVVDGHDGMGMVIGKRCMQMAIDKAREHGLGMVVARNSTHYGFAAYYPLMAVRRRHDRPDRHQRPPVDRADPRRGQHARHQPAGLRHAHRRGVPLHQRLRHLDHPARQDRAVGPRGQGLPRRPGHRPARASRPPTPCRSSRTSSRARRRWRPSAASTEETGGYKGYGFATVVEILSAALSQGAFLKQLGGKDAQGKDIPIPLGHFFLAIDIECFTDLAAFKKTTGDILRALRASTKAPGKERIYTCGEKEYLAWQERKDKGAPVDAGVQRELVAMRDELELPYTFPFERA